MLGSLQRKQLYRVEKRLIFPQIQRLGVCQPWLETLWSLFMKQSRLNMDMIRTEPPWAPSHSLVLGTKPCRSVSEEITKDELSEGPTIFELILKRVDMSFLFSVRWARQMCATMQFIGMVFLMPDPFDCVFISESFQNRNTNAFSDKSLSMHASPPGKEWSAAHLLPVLILGLPLSRVPLWIMQQAVFNAYKQSSELMSPNCRVPFYTKYTKETSVKMLTGMTNLFPRPGLHLAVWS